LRSPAYLIVAGHTSEERAELARLRQENRELRREKDFFRLAAAHFAKEQLPPRGFA
jgi:transposase